MKLKDKILEISKNLQNLAENNQSGMELSAILQLSEEQAMFFQMIKVFIKAVDNNVSDEDIINMIFINGLVYEIEKMKESRNNIYNMGNLEMLADENGVGLSDDERQVAAATVSLPKTIDEYWELGYTTIICPNCQQRAVWHRQTMDYQCLDGCRKSGIMEDK